MAARLSYVGLGVVVGLVIGAASGIRAEDSLPEVPVEVAAGWVGVRPIDLAGAVASTGLGPIDYLFMAGHLVRNPSSPAVDRYDPIPGITARYAWQVACIEGKESQGFNVWNRQGSGAGGVLQYMAGTFRAHAAHLAAFTGDQSIHGWSLWDPTQARIMAAFDLSRGLRRQWTVGGC